ncbi:MAG: alpha-galactosidase [Clostridia bacterium]|nr:alpha-galactosidase [Clostridia bacterium]
MTDNGELSFRFSCPRKGRFSCEKQAGEPGVDCYRVRMAWDGLETPPATVMRFGFPATDTYSVFECRRFDRAKNWGGVERTSRLAADLPLLQLISKKGKNRYLFTLSDVKTPVKLRVKCDYTDMTAEGEIIFFTELTDPIDCYECVLRIDTRPIPFTQALKDASGWFAALGYVPARVPEAAYDPLYSTWYSYLTKVTAEDVLRECRAAKELGMDTVIIDDGWQRQDGASVYGYCGDWKPFPVKFPDMAGLIRALHGLGMKVLLWYAVPFVGHYSDQYAGFQGKYLNEADGCDCAVLDPRFPEVRAFLADTYVSALKAWKPDGFKLDFIDRFRTNGVVSEGMDTASVEDATFRLLSEIYRALTEENPDVLIEFRQPYSGPVIGAFGNMIRVWDCPNDGLTNRVSSLNLRLTSSAAVHSDPIRWHRDESPEQTAVLLWGTLFSVPQISVRLAELGPEQAAVLRNYLGFWRAHRDTLMKGELTVQSQECLFSLVSSSLGEETVALCSAQNYVDVSPFRRAYLCNLTEMGTLAVGTVPGTRITVRDCLGRTVEEQTAQAELCSVKVPLGGLAELSRT